MCKLFTLYVSDYSGCRSYGEGQLLYVSLVVCHDVRTMQEGKGKGTPNLVHGHILCNNLYHIPKE